MMKNRVTVYYSSILQDLEYNILKGKYDLSDFIFNMLYNMISYMYNMIKKEVLYKALCAYLS